MGLVFPLQPIRKTSRNKGPENPDRPVLLLKTSSKRFTVGSSLLCIGMILFSMFLAAGPLFQTMMDQGNWFDYLLAGFFYSMLFVFPLIAFLCWFYQETLRIEKSEGIFSLQYSRNFGPVKFFSRATQLRSLDELVVANWMGARNMASIKPDPNAPEQKRYATRGHWMLRLENAPTPLVLERRAKKEEIDWLKAIITNYFT